MLSKRYESTEVDRRTRLELCSSDTPFSKMCPRWKKFKYI